MSTLAGRFLTTLQDQGLGTTLRKVLTHLWSTETNLLILRCDLHDLPASPSPKVEVRLQPVYQATFSGYSDELERTSGSDVADLRGGMKMAAAGLERLFVAYAPTGEPMFAQWLVTQDGLPIVRRVSRRDLFPPLDVDEILAVGGYTFTGFRRLGVMTAGLHQALMMARDEGFRGAVTEVRPGNVPSLRACARVGFHLDYVAQDLWRLGRFRRRHARSRRRDLAAWQAALASPTPGPAAGT